MTVIVNARQSFCRLRRQTALGLERNNTRQTPPASAFSITSFVRHPVTKLREAIRGVLLTRARQGMVIFVPLGDHGDATRPPVYYYETFAYLERIGIKVL